MKQKEQNMFALQLAKEIGKRATMVRGMIDPPRFDMLVVDDVPVRIISISTLPEVAYGNTQDATTVTAHVVFNDKEYQLTASVMASQNTNIFDMVEHYALVEINRKQLEIS